MRIDTKYRVGQTIWANIKDIVCQIEVVSVSVFASTVTAKIEYGYAKGKAVNGEEIGSGFVDERLCADNKDELLNLE